MDSNTLQSSDFDNRIDQLNDTLGKTSNTQNLEQALNNLFPSANELTRVQKARQILGETATTLTDEQVESYIVKFEYLVGCWLDLFEKQLFKGKILKELLKLT